MHKQMKIGLMSTLALLVSIPACSSSQGQRTDTESPVTSARDETNPVPPPNIQAWMDRLTVDHAYDPETGFIVAREVIGLPSIIASGPSADEAVRMGKAESRPVVIFATADRCAPCQQYKKSALNHPAVIEALNSPSLITTHVEVDRQPELADEVIGSRAIPMTYLFLDGELVSSLRGQRSAEELLEWLANLPAS
jgi:hypothetical protein